MSGILRADLLSYAIHLTVFLAFLLNPIDIESTDVRGGVKIGSNSQAVIKAAFVASAGMIGVVGWWRFSAVRNLFATSVGILSLTLSFLYFVTAPFSILPSVSIVAGIAFFSYLLFFVTAIVVVGPEQIFYNAIVALCCLFCAGWFCFLFVPSIGVYHEYTGQTSTFSRMTGLAHPNALGANAGLVVILAVAAAQINAKRAWIFRLIALFAFATVVASVSRTAIAACLLSLMFLYRHWALHRFVLATMVPGIFAIAIGLLYLENEYGMDRIVHEVLVRASKSNDASEITSATGRTEIWKYGIKKIRQCPFYGYGANTSPIVMKNHSFQAHNIVLNPALSFGIPGGIIMVLWLLLNLYWAIYSKSPFVVGVSIFIILSGFTEDTLLSTFPEPATLAWFVVSFTPYLAFAKAGTKRNQATEAVTAV